MLEILHLEIFCAILIPCSAGNQKSKELQISGPEGNRLKFSPYPSYTVPCPFRHCDARGKDIHQAAEQGNVGAVRHFLRVDPESLERSGGRWGRSLGTDVGSNEADPHLP